MFFPESPIFNSLTIDVEPSFSRRSRISGWNKTMKAKIPIWKIPDSMNLTPVRENTDAIRYPTKQMNTPIISEPSFLPFMNLKTKTKNIVSKKISMASLIPKFKKADFANEIKEFNIRNMLLSAALNNQLMYIPLER